MPGIGAGPGCQSRAIRLGNVIPIGAHEREGDPLAVAKATGAEVIQFFLGDPQGWGAPTFPGGDAAGLRSALSEAGLEVFIHAPYGINVASANNRIRIPSRKIMFEHAAAAHAIAVACGMIRRLNGYSNSRP